mgnify:CR=1 FL=1
MNKLAASASVTVTASSNGKVILKGVVNDDYSAYVSVPKGSIINTSSVTGAIAMRDIASLGIEGTKAYEKTHNKYKRNKPFHY